MPSGSRTSTTNPPTNNVNDSDVAFITPAEAQRILRIGRSALYDGLRRGAIPSIRIGKLIRIPASFVQGK